MLENLKKNEKTIELARQISNSLVVLPTIHELSWIINLIIYFCAKIRAFENSKSLSINRVNNQLTIPTRNNKSYLSETSTQEIIAHLVEDVPLHVTKPIEYKDITKSVDEIIDQRITNQQIRNLEIFRCTSNQRQQEAIRKSKNISPEKYERKNRKIMENGRKIEIVIEEPSKRLSIICVPSSIESEIVFDVDFYSLTKEMINNIHQNFIQSTAEYLSIPKENVIIISSVAGSLKLKFQVMMKKLGVKEKVGALYDKITHHNYLTTVANAIKLKTKKPIETKVIWKFTCNICGDKFKSLEEGLMCTGQTPHWTCCDCLVRLTRVKFEECAPDIQCAQGCEARYINTHLIQKITSFTNNPNFHVQYTQATLMQFKLDHPYPQHVQCNLCNYITENGTGQTTWTCGEGVVNSILVDDGRPCFTEWCLECEPMAKAHEGPHNTSTEATLYQKISAAIDRGFLLTCPKFLTKECNNSASIVKEEGCNKMTCNQCGTNFCFECNVNLDDLNVTYNETSVYSHFGKDYHPCKLFGENDEDTSKKRARKSVDDLFQTKSCSTNEFWDIGKNLLEHIQWQPVTI